VCSLQEYHRHAPRLHWEGVAAEPARAGAPAASGG